MWKWSRVARVFHLTTISAVSTLSRLVESIRLFPLVACSTWQLSSLFVSCLIKNSAAEPSRHHVWQDKSGVWRRPLTRNALRKLRTDLSCYITGVLENPSTVRADPHLQMVYFEFSQIPDLTSSLRHTTRLSVDDIMMGRWRTETGRTKLWTSDILCVA